MGSRKRPLQTCWITLLEISSKAYATGSRNFNGGNSVLNFASPSVICALQCQILAILVFLDDWILRIESFVEAIFPPLRQIFNKIDEIVKLVEGLPEKLDDTIKKISALVHQVPFMDWVLVHSISWLRFLINIMIDWDIVGVKEKINVADVNYRRKDGLIGKKKNKKTKKMDVQIVTSKEESNPNDHLLTTEETITSDNLISNDHETVEGRSEIHTRHIDVQTVMIDGLMVQQAPDRLTILTGNDAMVVHDEEEMNYDSKIVEKKCTDIDPKAVEDTKESASTSNEEPMKMISRDIDDQPFEADRPTIIHELVHQIFPTINDEQSLKDNDENYNIQSIDKILTSNESKTAEGTEEHVLTSNEQPKVTVEGINDQTFASNGSMNENASDHQASHTSNDEIIIQKSNQNNNVAPGTNQKLPNDDPIIVEGTVKQLGLTSNGEQAIATQETGDLTSSSIGLKIGQEVADNQTFLTTSEMIIPQENGDQMLPWNESEIDQSVTSNGSTLVSETDDTTMDSDCSQIKSDRKIFAPFPNEPETSVVGIPRTSSSNMIKGSYKDVLEKGKHERIEEIHRHKGLRPDKSRRQGKKVARGTQEESREGKGRRKGKRKKADNKI